jgi:branched-chain amino acid transport system ATP-binding protein
MNLLELREIRVFYDRVEAVKGVSLHVNEGEMVTLIGANGAGKTTILRAISGLTPARHGSVLLDGEDVTRRRSDRIAGLGVAHVPEGRQVFPRMTVRENLELGAYRRRTERWADDLEAVFELFPRVKERLEQQAGTLSGGEQQMLAVGRAMMARPRLMLLDEPSLGVAPVIVQRLYEALAEINRRGTTVLLVEQNVNFALRYASRGYVLETGTIVLDDDSVALAANPSVRDAYLAGGD